MPWTITKDHIADPGVKQPSNANAVGMVGPRGSLLTAEQIIAHPHGRKFRIRDGDGELYYEGVSVITDSGDEDEVGPLDDFGRPNAGATDIEYQRADGSWEVM